VITRAPEIGRSMRDVGIVTKKKPTFDFTLDPRELEARVITPAVFGRSVRYR